MLIIALHWLYLKLIPSKLIFLLTFALDSFCMKLRNAYLFFIVLFFSNPQLNNAAVLGSIQKGTTILAAGSISVTQVISAITLNKSFLVFNIRANSNSPEAFMIGGGISASNQLEFIRDVGAGSPAVTIEWQVFSFSSGVNVQRGVINGLTDVGNNITLSPAVNLASSFATVNMSKDGLQYGSDDGMTANLTATNNLYVDRFTGGANPQIVYWQVIEWTGSVVQKITATLSAGVDSTSVTLGTAVNKSKTMVIGGHQITANVNAADLPATELLNNNTVIFTRVGTAATFNFLCYVVEFTDNTDVVHGVIRMTAAQSNVSTAICAVTPSVSGIISPSEYFRAGANCQTADDNIGIAWATFQLTNSVTVNAQRGGTGFAVRFPFQVLEFSAATPVSCIPTEPGNSTPRRVGLCIIPLSIELIDFKVLNCENKVCLEWETAQEKNNDYFEIQKSSDGISFETIQQVKSKASNGNSHSKLEYEAIDKNVLQNEMYYRLKQVDFDKSFSYSTIVSIGNFKEKNIKFLVYPNPNSGEFTVDISGIENNHKVKILLIDEASRIVYNSFFYTSDINESKFLIIPKNKLKAGIYFCKLIIEELEFTIKVIVS
jgi:hypothetical protein